MDSERLLTLAHAPAELAQVDESCRKLLPTYPQDSRSSVLFLSTLLRKAGFPVNFLFLAPWLERELVGQGWQKVESPAPGDVFFRGEQEAGLIVAHPAENRELTFQGSCPLSAGLRVYRFVGEVPVPTGGPGTELKKLLSRMGIVATPNCSCNRRAQQMDEWGVEGCRERIPIILGWLQEEAEKRRLPFSELLAHQLLRLALRKAAQGGG